MNAKQCPKEVGGCGSDIQKNGVPSPLPLAGHRLLTLATRCSWQAGAIT